MMTESLIIFDGSRNNNFVQMFWNDCIIYCIKCKKSTIAPYSKGNLLHNYPPDLINNYLDITRDHQTNMSLSWRPYIKFWHSNAICWQLPFKDINLSIVSSSLGSIYSLMYDGMNSMLRS